MKEANKLSKETILILILIEKGILRNVRATYNDRDALCGGYVKFARAIMLRKSKKRLTWAYCIQIMLLGMMTDFIFEEKSLNSHYKPKILFKW